MGAQGAKMTGYSAAGLAEYFADADKIAGYYGPAGIPRGGLDRDFVVFGPDQIDGRAAERIGIDLARGVTAGDIGRLIAGQHLVTGEALVKHRGAPVYEIDPATKRPLLDADGNKIRKMEHPIDPMTGAPDLSRLVPAIDHSGGTDAAQVIVNMHKSATLAILATQAHNPARYERLMAGFDQVLAGARGYIEDNARLYRRTVTAPIINPDAGQHSWYGSGPLHHGGTATATAAGTATATKTTRQQGTGTERDPADLAMMTAIGWLSRPTEETIKARRTPDIGLHGHILIANACYDPATGKTGKIDAFGLTEKNFATGLASFVDGALHQLFVDEGFEIQYGDFDTDRNGRLAWRVKNVPLAAEAYMSTNSARRELLAEDYAAKHDGERPSPALLRKLMAESKLPKDPKYKIQDSTPDFDLWRDEMTEHGVEWATPELVAEVTREAPEVRRAPHEERTEELWRRLDGPNGLCWQSSTFKSYEAFATLMRCAEGLDFTPDQLRDLNLEMINRTVALATEVREGHYVGHDGTTYGPHNVPRTTPSQLSCEERIAWTLKRMAAAEFPAVPPAILEAVLATRSLDDEQTAIARAVAAGRGLTFVIGDAGTGKTTTMRSAVDAMRTAGVIDKVVVVSTAALTGNDTGAKLGADVSGSFQRIATLVERGALKIDSKTLVVAEEVAMASSANIDALLSVAGQARLVGLGDPEQALPIGAAGWFQDAIEADQPEAVFRLTNVRRQRDPADKEANRAIREGRGNDAVDNLDSRGRLHVSETQQDTWNLAGSMYRGFRDQGLTANQVVVIVPGGSYETVDSLIRVVQANRIAHGEIPAEGFSYRATDTGRTWSLHAGDPVVFLETCRAADGTRIDNGARGIAERVDPASGRVIVALTDGMKAHIALDPSAPTQPFCPAYAVHHMKYQGAENEVSLVVPPEVGRIRRNDIYSANTRAVWQTHVLMDHESHGADPKVTLAEAISAEASIDSARRIRGDVTTPAPSPETPTPSPSPEQTSERQTPEPSASEAERLEVITAAAGEGVAADARAGDRWGALTNKLDRLRREGVDDNQALRTALADTRGFADVKDASRILLWRIDQKHPDHRPTAPGASGVTDANSAAPVEPTNPEASTSTVPAPAPAVSARDTTHEQRVESSTVGAANKATASPHAPTPGGWQDEIHIDARLWHLERVVGDVHIARLKDDPAYQQIHAVADRLEAAGLDERTMISNAARDILRDARREARQAGRSQPLDNDVVITAASLAERLETTRRVGRTPPPKPLVREPQVPWLIGPTERGPEPRVSGMDVDDAADIARLGQQWRQSPPPPPQPARASTQPVTAEPRVAPEVDAASGPSHPRATIPPPPVIETEATGSPVAEPTRIRATISPPPVVETGAATRSPVAEPTRIRATVPPPPLEGTVLPAAGSSEVDEVTQERLERFYTRLEQNRERHQSRTIDDDGLDIGM